MDIHVIELNGSKMVKRLLGVSCLEGGTLAVFLHHAALPVHTQGAHTVLMPCSHPQCSKSCSAAAATAGFWSGAGLQGVGVGDSRQQAWRQQHLPSGSSIPAVLSSGHISSVKERPCVRGIPQPRFVGLCCI